MRVPPAAELLDVWERALGESPTGRALSLVAAAYPELRPDEVAALPIGRRDARLLNLRKCLFGPRLLLVVPCPQCGEHLESELETDAIDCGGGRPDAATYRAESDGYRLSFRLPTSADLIALTSVAADIEPRHLLIRRCLIDVRDASGCEKTADDLPDVVLAHVVEQMQAMDPVADIELALSCPACGHQWQAGLDIAAFLWRELHAWAQRTLRDVHVLARAYGWREADSLSLSPTRRQIYLELCRQ